MGKYTGVSAGSKIRNKKTRKLTDNEIETARNTILAGMLPSSPSENSARNLHRSKIWLRRNPPHYYG